MATTAFPLVFRNPTSFKFIFLFAIGFWLVVCQHPATAQPGSKTVPNDAYFRAFDVYNQGQYQNAYKFFREAQRGGVRTIDGRWIDSVCYHTMLGECLYRLGKLPEALEHYEAALQIYVAYTDWMLRVDFPLSIEPDKSVGTRTTWGISARASQLGRYPDKMKILIGRLDNDLALQQGGVVQRPEQRMIRTQEIVRCTALAIRRRRELMGPICSIDPFTAKLVNAAARRSVPPNHWSSAWADALAGMAYASKGEIPKATTALKRSLLAAGQFDHPLTSQAMLQLGQFSLQQGNYDEAIAFFHEATLVAAQFGYFDEMEEAFRFGTIAHIVSGKKGIYAPLAAAASWAGNRMLPLRASVLLSACECATAQGDWRSAAELLSQAQKSMRRSDMHTGVIGARAKYQEAHVSFQRGNLTVGTTALKEVLSFQKTSSKRLFQIAMANEVYSEGQVSSRLANDLFTNVLREPTANDWTLDPLETLSVVATPHVTPLENWFEILLLERKELSRALEVAEMVRRHRFYSTLPLGGRLLALRWILEAPKESLSERALLQRGDLLAKFPGYAEVGRKVAALRKKLDVLELTPHDAREKKEQTALLEELGTLSMQQEVILSDIALRRQPSEFVFPPLRSVAEIQARLPADQAVLAFFNTQRRVYTFTLTKKKLDYHVVEHPRLVETEIVDLLKKMGHFNMNQPIGRNELSSDAWKEPAAKILELLTGTKSPEFIKGFKDLAVVPDSVLWYVPFELLQAQAGTRTIPLMSKLRVRYAPTVALCVPDGRNHKRAAKTAVVIGKLFPRDERAVTEEAFKDLREALPGASRVDDHLQVPSGLFSTICDRLIVLDEIDGNASGPYSWSPMQVDRGKPGSALASWFALPWNGPQQVIIPGFHTRAEESLKRGGTGDEIFLTLCGLMSTGTRTILISRWRTAGQSTFELIREFARQLPRGDPSRAWHRSVQLSFAAPIDPDLEPRVNATGITAPVKGDHPFFWSGYLLVDTGGATDTGADLVVEAAGKKEPDKE